MTLTSIEIINENAVLIPLSGSVKLFSIVDAEDVKLVQSFKWYPTKPKKDGILYAIANPVGRKPGDSNIRMHRMLLGLTFGDKRVVDHVNHNGLDNRRSNLRICTQTENTRNMRPRNGTISGFKGVSLRKDGKWLAAIYVGNRRICLGLFNDKEAAARAYDARAIELFGAFACLNFPGGEV